VRACQSGTVCGVNEALAAGRDADVYAIDAKRVLRRYRDGGDVDAEAAVMAYVRRHGFPVPQVYDASGADMVMERLDGPTMLAALVSGTLDVDSVARILADLHRRLHEIPARPGGTADDRVLHMDLRPANVMLASRGAVLVDWRNATEGPADLDVSISAVIMAQVAVGESEMTVPAGLMLAAFVREVDGDPVRLLDRAVAIRGADPALTADEVALLDAAFALVKGRSPY
jgi:aminoglycoside phosphotransferase (APT) family kinase protein